MTRTSVLLLGVCVVVIVVVAAMTLRSSVQPVEIPSAPLVPPALEQTDDGNDLRLLQRDLVEANRRVAENRFGGCRGCMWPPTGIRELLGRGEHRSLAAEIEARDARIRADRTARRR